MHGSNYIVTARKWRPQQFAEVVGQQHITQTLRNAIKQQRIHHAYLFAGPRGVGKTTTARILARAVNCENPDEGEPCNHCQPCQLFQQGRSTDVFEIDGASHNSVDDVRLLRESAKYPPQLGRFKIYIIDEVHMLSNAAFNALLKTLEEPPPHLLFIFATTEPQKLPATIISRCQRFDFRRMTIQEIADHLAKIAAAEGITIEEQALLTVALKADGSMRDAQSIFDQLVAFSGTHITYADVQQTFHLIDQQFFFDVERTLAQGEIRNVFDIVRQIFAQGYDFSEFLSGLITHYRHLLTVAATGTADLIPLSAEWQAQYMERASAYSPEALLNVLTVLTEGEQQLKFAPNPRIFLEVLLSKIALLDKALHLGALLEQLQTGSAATPSFPETTAEQRTAYHSSPSKTSPSTTLPSATDTKASTSRAARSNTPKLTPEFVLNLIQQAPELHGIRRLFQMVKIVIEERLVKFIPNDAIVGEILAQRQNELAALLSEALGQAIAVEIQGIKKPTIYIFEHLATAQSTSQTSNKAEQNSPINQPLQPAAEAAESEAERKLKEFFNLKRVK